MPASPAVVQAFASSYSLTALMDIQRDAASVFANGGTVSRSYEGSSLTIDLMNAERIIETVQAAIEQKRAMTQGCDPDLEQGQSRVVSYDFSTRQIR